MKQWWRRQAGKIDAMPQRERALIFIAVIAVVSFLANMLVIDPLNARKTALAARMVQQQIEVQQLRATAQSLEKQLSAPDAAVFARRDGVRHQIGEIDASLKDMQHSLVRADSMQAVLQEVLARNPRLQLVSMNTLPVAPLVEKRDKAEKSAVAIQPRDRTAATEAGVFKHGVQIKLQGSYADMYEYLARLEKLPWRMFWARASLSAADYPNLTITVTIYTLSLDKAWLVV